MTLFNKSSLWLLVPLAGCAFMPAPLVRLPEVTVSSEPEQSAPAGPVVLAAYDEPLSDVDFPLFGHT